MIYSLIGAAIVIASVHAAGEVTFIHRPESISFKGNERLDQSLLQEVYSACLGFTTKHNSDWSGLKIANPFNYAEAIVTLVVDGMESFGTFKGHHFPLNTDADEDLTWDSLERRVKNRFPSDSPTLMRVLLSDSTNSIPHPESQALPSVQYLDLNVPEDREFLNEVAALQEIVQKVKSKGASHDGIPDVYWFVLLGLHPVRDLHGIDSDAAKEAMQLLHNTVTDMNKAFTSAYDGRVLVSVVTSDVSHTRQTRSLKAPVPADNNISNGTDLNLASDYPEEWPVQFNICLWFMVAFVMALIATSITFLEMDPGRDSIIYRMTSMKTMKKEN